MVGSLFFAAVHESGCGTFRKRRDVRLESAKRGGGYTGSVVSSGADPSYCAQRYQSYDPASGTYLGYEVPTALSKVRFQGQPGGHLLTRSSSQIDPRTSVASSTFTFRPPGIILLWTTWTLDRSGNLS